MTAESVVNPAMSDFPSLESKLAKFGLSGNQAAIYLHLIQNGDLRIGELASLTKQPRSSVYENLKALDSLGLIERVVGANFVRIKAYPLDSLRHSLEQRAAELEKLSVELEALDKIISSLPGA